LEFFAEFDTSLLKRKVWYGFSFKHDFLGHMIVSMFIFKGEFPCSSQNRPTLKMS
jgi:hypothetical protein